MSKQKKNDEDADPVITPEEVGRRIGKSGNTVRRWIQDGLLKSVLLPSGLRGVRESEVNAMLRGSALAERVP